MIRKLAKAIRETWFFWPFFFLVAFMTARQIEATRSSPRADLMTSLTFAFLVAFWVVLDARRRQQQMGYGFPALVFLIWPIFAPIYLFQTRGSRAFFSLLGFLAAFCVAAGLGAFIGDLTRN